MKLISIVVVTGIIFEHAWSIFSFETHCTKPNDPLKNLLTDPISKIDFKLIKGFSLQTKILGKGSWAIVKSVDFDGVNRWPDSLGRKTAVKMIDSAKKLLLQDYLIASFKKEARVMYELRKEPWIAKMYACVESSPYYYAAQEMMSKSLGDETVQNDLRKKSAAQLLKIFMPLFRGLAVLESKNFVHNDIKPENIMSADDNLTDLRFVDFGFANELNSEPAQVSRDGAPLYLSINRQSGKYHSILDDVYALITTMATILDANKIFFYQSRLDRLGNKVHIDNNCFLNKMKPHCHVELIANSKRFFEILGFGRYTEASLEEMNVTTLFTKVVEYGEITKISYKKILARLEELEKSLSNNVQKPAEQKKPVESNDIRFEVARKVVQAPQNPTGLQKVEYQPRNAGENFGKEFDPRHVRVADEQLKQRINDILNRNKASEEIKNKVKFVYENKEPSTNALGYNLKPQVVSIEKNQPKPVYPKNQSFDARIEELEKQRKKLKEERLQAENRDVYLNERLRRNKLLADLVPKRDYSADQYLKKQPAYLARHEPLYHRGFGADLINRGDNIGYHPNRFYEFNFDQRRNDGFHENNWLFI